MTLDHPAALEGATRDQRDAQFDVYFFDGPISDRIASIWSGIRGRRRGLFLPLAASLIALVRGDSLMHVVLTLAVTLGALYFVNRLLRGRPNRPAGDGRSGA